MIPEGGFVSTYLVRECWIYSALATYPHFMIHEMTLEVRSAI